MSSTPDDHVATIWERLAQYPVHRSVFDNALSIFSDLRGANVGLSGSIARAQMDTYSDIDFWLAFSTDAELVAARPAVVAGMLTCGRPIAHFPATHLGAPNLLIFFTEVANTVVKTDIELVTLDEFTKPAEFIALVDPQGRFEDVPRRSRVEPDVGELSNRLAGWMWYAYTKIARGDAFEAVSALDTMRALAIVPLLRSLGDSPQEGYRRLEGALEPSDIAALRTTYPASFAQADVLAALFRLTNVFLSGYTRLHRRRNVFGGDRVSAMLAAIERDQAAKARPDNGPA